MTENPLTLLRHVAAEADAGVVRTTRRRIVLEATTSSRRRLSPFLVCLAASVLAPAAWAAAAAVLAPRPPVPRSVESVVISPRPQSSLAATPALATLDVPAVAPVVAPAPVAPAPKPPVKRGPRSSTPDELATFEAAHEAHHHGDDPALALSRWDDYLSQFPNGRFLPEALYARAVALDRLHRMDEARDAFTSFARGDFGDYRRTEAARWLALHPRDALAR